MGLDKNFNTAGANEMELAGGGLTSATLSNCLKEGKPLADTGDLYSTIQDAENAASSWVFVPPGTFNESVSIDTAGLTIAGAGYDTLIDGGTTNHAVEVTANDVTVTDLSVKTTAGSGNTYNGVQISSGGCNVVSVVVRDSDHRGIRVSTNCKVINCRIESTDSDGIYSGNRSENPIYAHNVIRNCGGYGIHVVAVDAIVACNIINDPNSLGIFDNRHDEIYIGNRIINASDHGIYTKGADNIIANNRVSDSTNSDLSDEGSGTLLDANLTGASN
jgi:hypothetical protein